MPLESIAVTFRKGDIMSYTALYRKFRPSTFDQVKGQDHIVQTLKNQINANRIGHAYLFCGTRGTGKTSVAKIFAKAVNCEHPVDGSPCNECETCRGITNGSAMNVIEIDAASNNGVDNIRQIRDEIQYSPSSGKYTVYIIDEVHMLSQAAFNAFLKTLEEPPHHAIFILATTEKHKILPTILSRCQIYDFNRISVSDMVEHLESVALKEHVEAEPEALNVIAQKADGGMRDALSIFDQVVSFTNGHITYKSVIDNLNVLDYEYYFRLTDCFLENKVTECMLLFNDVLKKGFDGNHFITGLSSHLRDLLVSRDPATLPLLEVGASIRERYQAQAQKCTPQFLYKAMKLCNDCDLNYRLSKNKRLLVELTLIQVAQLTAEAEEPGQGRSPKQTLSPVFNQATAQAAQPATPKPQPAAGNYAAQPAGNYASTLQQPNASYRPAEPVQPATSAPSPQASASGAGPMHANPLPKTSAEKKIPVMKAGSMGISIRRSQAPQTEKAAPAAQATAAIPQADANWEDYIFNEKDLNYYWREFAARLPKEEAANAGRMMNMQPQLLKDGVTFEVAVDNDIVQKYMQQLAPHIETHLRTQLHNRKIRMTVRVSAPNENIRAYSHVERFQMMSQKNPKLLKLKEALGLELS